MRRYAIKQTLKISSSELLAKDRIFERIIEEGFSVGYLFAT